MSSRFVSPFYDVGSGLKPPSGALLEFFEVDGTTPKDTFSDQLSTPTANTNPVVANSVGVFGNIFITGDYKVTLKKSNGTQIFGLATVSEFVTGSGQLVNVLSRDTLNDAVIDTSLQDGLSINLKERTTGNGGGAMWDVVLASSVTPNTFNIVQCTGIPTLALVLRCDEKTHVKAFGVVGDGIENDSSALLAAWNIVLASSAKTFNCFGAYRYKMTDSPTGAAEGHAGSYFYTNGVDDITIKSEGSFFFVDNSTSGASVLFNVAGSKGFNFDKISGGVPFATMVAGNSLVNLLISYLGSTPSSETIGDTVKGVNGAGVTIIGDSADYATNGLASTIRPFNTFIRSIIIDNSEELFTFGPEYGLALRMAFGGDNTNVDYIYCKHIHRAVHAYGMKGLNIEWLDVKETDATTILLGTFASLSDITIKAKLTQNTDLASEMTRITPYEIGNAGGASVDLENGRTHVIENINLDLNIGGTGAIQSGFSLYKLPGDGSDSNIEIIDIEIKLKNTSAISRSFKLFTTTAAVNIDNMIVRGLKVSGEKLLSKGDATLVPGLEGDIEIEGLDGTTLALSYADATPPTNRYILRGVRMQGGIDDNKTDVPVVIYDSSLSRQINVANTVSMFNKSMYNTQLGNALIESKGVKNIYSNISTSTARYNPDNPIKNLVIGGSIFVGSPLTPLDLDLVSPDDTSSISTGDSVNFFAESFEGAAIFAVSKTRKVKIISENSVDSGFGITTGELVAYGVVGGDLTTGTFELSLSDTVNTGTVAFVNTDFTISVKNSRELTLSCSRAATDLIFTVTD